MAQEKWVHTNPLKIVHSTDKAVLVQIITGSDDTPEVEEKWMPMSVVETQYVNHDWCVVAIATWFIEKESLAGIEEAR